MNRNTVCKQSFFLRGADEFPELADQSFAFSRVLRVTKKSNKSREKATKNAGLFPAVSKKMKRNKSANQFERVDFSFKSLKKQEFFRTEIKSASENLVVNKK